MAYSWAALVDDIEDIVNATWTDVTAILEVHQSERRSWETITLPFAVLVVGAADEGQWGVTNIAYECPIAVWYFSKYSEAALALVRTKLEALKSALIPAVYAASSATPLEVSIDFSTTNEANQIALTKNVPLIGGAVTIRYVCGETAV